MKSNCWYKPKEWNVSDLPNADARHFTERGLGDTRKVTDRRRTRARVCARAETKVHANASRTSSVSPNPLSGNALRMRYANRQRCDFLAWTVLYCM